MKEGEILYCHNNEDYRNDFTIGRGYKIEHDEDQGFILKSDIDRTYLLCETDYMKHFKHTQDYNYISPSHYQNLSKETWEMMVDIWGKDKYIAHCEMCAFKYRMRLGSKPDQPIDRDLEKARWYENKAKELKES